MAINRYGFFAESKDENLLNLDEFAQKNHQKLLKESDVTTKARLLKSYHRAKPLNTRNYLRAFIQDFGNDPQFTHTVDLYRQKLAQYQQAKLQTTFDSLKPKDLHAETYKLTEQQQQWQKLMETLQHCVHRRFAKELVWHPHYLENYYLAKLFVQWQAYFNHYKPFNKAPLAKITAQEMVAERQQMIVEKSVDAHHQLDQDKMSYSRIRLTRQYQKLDENKKKALEMAKNTTPVLERHAHHVLQMTETMDHHESRQLYKAALEEIHRQTHQIHHNPALFKKASSPEATYSLTTLKQIDSLPEMQAYGEIFQAKSQPVDVDTHHTTPTAH